MLHVKTVVVGTPDNSQHLIPTPIFPPLLPLIPPSHDNGKTEDFPLLEFLTAPLLTRVTPTSLPEHYTAQCTRHYDSLKWVGQRKNVFFTFFTHSHGKNEKSWIVGRKEETMNHARQIGQLYQRGELSSRPGVRPFSCQGHPNWYRLGHGPPFDKILSQQGPPSEKISVIRYD